MLLLPGYKEITFSLVHSMPVFLTCVEIFDLSKAILQNNSSIWINDTIRNSNFYCNLYIFQYFLLNPFSWKKVLKCKIELPLLYIILLSNFIQFFVYDSLNTLFLYIRGTFSLLRLHYCFVICL